MGVQDDGRERGHPWRLDELRRQAGLRSTLLRARRRVLLLLRPLLLSPLFLTSPA